MAHHALLERSVVLRAAKNIGHDLAENRAAAKKLDHAGGDGGAEKRAAIETADDFRGELQFAGKRSTHPIRIHLRIAFSDGLAEKFPRAHRVEETFSGERGEAQSGEL